MSMSSTQARNLLNTEQLANCEFEGQQINQARSVLSAKSAAEQASMLSLEVPTPPATTDYQTVQYNGSLGATKYSFDASSVKPNGSTYTITMKEQKYGDSLQKNVQVALVNTSAAGGFKGEVVNTSATTQTTQTTQVGTGVFEESTDGNITIVPISQSDIDNATTVNEDGSTTVKKGTYYIKTDAGFVKTTCEPTAGCYKLGGGEGSVKIKEKTVESSTIVENNNGLGFIQAGEISNYYVEENGIVRPADPDKDFTKDPTQPNILKFKSGVTYLKPSENGTSYQMQGDIAGVTVGGKGVHEPTEEEMQLYGDAIANCGLKDANGNDYTAEDFLIYYDDKGGAVFVLKNDVYDGNNNAVTYSYVANGEYTKNQTYNDAQLIFDPSNGRITEVQIPNYDKEGNIVSWSSITVEAETVIDNAAYDDACAQYQYDNMIYEQKLQECQKKIDDIQREDKNLELQLQRLDTKRQQLTTEKEALEKVLQDSVESFKTFSG